MKQSNQDRNSHSETESDCVTVGIPVYNGGTMIGECLDSVLAQTYKNIEIIVLDNASTDNTQSIVEEIALLNPRVIYRRQTHNVGMMQNFLDVMEQAQSRYFLWLCHDDLWSANYVEELLSALRGMPGAKLAAPGVETYRDGTLKRTTLPPGQSLRGSEVGIRKLLFRSYQAWFCGLWDVEALRPVVRQVWADYPSPWGPDHLTLYPFLIDRAVSFAPNARYIQRITIKEKDNSHRRDQISVLIDLRRRFWRQCQRFLDQRCVTGPRRLFLNTLTWFYVGKRVYSLRKLAKRFLREKLNFRH